MQPQVQRETVDRHQLRAAFMAPRWKSYTVAWSMLTAEEPTSGETKLGVEIMKLVNSKYQSALFLSLGALLIASVASPAMATLITNGTYSGDISASNPITVQNPANCNAAGVPPGGGWTGAPELNPYQVFAATNTIGVGPQFLNLNFNSDCGSTEYGVNWQMNNLSGQTWYSMHFTVSFAPLSNFSASFDDDNFDSTPNTSGGKLPLTGWSTTTIDFVGLPGVPNFDSEQFHIPLDMRGDCCNGNIIITATPDFDRPLPEPSTISLLAVAVAALGSRGAYRRRA